MSAFVFCDIWEYMIPVSCHPACLWYGPPQHDNLRTSTGGMIQNCTEVLRSKMCRNGDRTVYCDALAVSLTTTLLTEIPLLSWCISALALFPWTEWFFLSLECKWMTLMYGLHVQREIERFMKWDCFSSVEQQCILYHNVLAQFLQE